MSIELIGERELFKALLELSKDSAIRVMRPAISKALTPVRRQAKANIRSHKRSGMLNKAISKKAGGKRNSKKAWGKVFVKSKPIIWQGKRINPVKYAHLVEFGTRHSRPYPFIRNAMSQKRSEVNSILIREGWVNMAKFAGRLRNKHDTMRALRKARARFLR